MGVILKLALKNLRAHRTKTIIISLFITFGSAIVILGNSFLESVNRGLEKDFRANYTGDITIGAIPPEGTIADIFGANEISVTGDIPQIPALTDLHEVEDVLTEFKDISRTTKLISAKALIVKGLEVDFASFLDDDSVSFMDAPVFMLFAGEEGTYFDMFGGQHITEGRILDPASTENELFIDTRIKTRFQKFWKEELNVGDTVLVAGANTSGIVREAKVVGFFTPANEHSAMFQTIYCSPGFARTFGNLTYASGFAEGLPSGIDTELSAFSEDDLFGSGGDDDFFGDMINADGSNILSVNDVDFNSILGDTTLRDELNRSAEGSWHYVQAKLSNPQEADKITAELNRRFKELGIDAHAMNWKRAAASYTDSLAGINILFNILVIILAVVVFIIIMNTMVVSIIERTGEIGTMRAIGAEKSFVRALFYTEATLITFVSALAGVILAFIAIAVFNSLELTITNDFAKMILGGGQIQFSPTALIVMTTLIIAVAGSFLSNIYPVSSALKITPLKALSKGGD